MVQNACEGKLLQQPWKQGDSAESHIEGGAITIGEGNGTPLEYSFAWKIPWTEEPGRLQSMGSLRVGHD